MDLRVKEKKKNAMDNDVVDVTRMILLNTYQEELFFIHGIWYTKVLLKKLTNSILVVFLHELYRKI